MNTLNDLNVKLFEQMEKLSKEDITQEELEKEITRSESMIKIANVIISNGDLSKQWEEQGNSVKEYLGLMEEEDERD